MLGFIGMMQRANTQRARGVTIVDQQTTPTDGLDTTLAETMHSQVRRDLLPVASYSSVSLGKPAQHPAKPRAHALWLSLDTARGRFLYMPMNGK